MNVRSSPKSRFDRGKIPEDKRSPSTTPRANARPRYPFHPLDVGGFPFRISGFVLRLTMVWSPPSSGPRIWVQSLVRRQVGLTKLRGLVWRCSLHEGHFFGMLPVARVGASFCPKRRVKLRLKTATVPEHSVRMCPAEQPAQESVQAT